MYSGLVACDIAHLLLTIIYVMRRQRAGCEVLLLPGASPCQVNHSGNRVPPNKNRRGGRWLLDQTWDVQRQLQSPRRFCNRSRLQCVCVLPASSRCLLWLYLSRHDLQTKYRRAAEHSPPHQGLNASRQFISGLRRSPHPIPPWRASSSNRPVTRWPEQKPRLPSPANPQKPD
jgi:hypothetical protein